MRLAQLQQNPLCEHCKAVGRTVAASVADHVVPHENDGESFWEGELQSLCKRCHDAKTHRERAQRRRQGATR
jgi:5-methylcytosine-specific restriction endonuclease McrA